MLKGIRKCSSKRCYLQLGWPFMGLKLEVFNAGFLVS